MVYNHFFFACCLSSSGRPAPAAAVFGDAGKDRGSGPSSAAPAAERRAPTAPLHADQTHSGAGAPHTLVLLHQWAFTMRIISHPPPFHTSQILQKKKVDNF